MINEKSIILLARRDHLEAMRVAAGLTIYGHEVRVIFMDHPLSEADAQSEQAELLELSDIEPETTMEEMKDILTYLDPAALAKAVFECDVVVNV